MQFYFQFYSVNEKWIHEWIDSHGSFHHLISNRISERWHNQFKPIIIELFESIHQSQLFCLFISEKRIHEFIVRGHVPIKIYHFQLTSTAHLQDYFYRIFPKKCPHILIALIKFSGTEFTILCFYMKKKKTLSSFKYLTVNKRNPYRKLFW